MFTPFYHDLLSKYVAIFGSLFNDIQISRTDGVTPNTQFFKVPIAYGPREKYIAITQRKPTSDKPMSIQLPRMSFEITGIQADVDRKFPRSVKYAENNGVIFEPVPYDIQMQLNIMTKNHLDAVKIVEQILPYFNPDWTVAAQLVEQLDRTWDIPIVLQGQSHQEVYEGDFIEKRLIIWTLDFEIKGWLHGPIRQKKLIKFITVNTNSGKGPNDKTAIGKVTIQPGLTANGQPTTDISQTVDYLLIEKDDNWDYIVQSKGPEDE